MSGIVNPPTPNGFCFVNLNVENHCSCLSVLKVVGDCWIDRDDPQVYGLFLFYVAVALAVHLFLFLWSSWLILDQIRNGLRLNLKLTTVSAVWVAEIERLIYFGLAPHHDWTDVWGDADGTLYNLPVFLWITAICTLLLFYMAAVNRANQLSTAKQTFRSIRITLIVVLLFIFLLILPLRIAGDVTRVEIYASLTSIGIAIALIVTDIISLVYSVKILRLLRTMTAKSRSFALYLKRCTILMIQLDITFLVLVVLLIALAFIPPTPNLRIGSYLVYRILETVGVGGLLGLVSLKITKSDGTSGKPTAMTNTMEVSAMVDTTTQKKSREITTVDSTTSVPSTTGTPSEPVSLSATITSESLPTNV